jgi:hypothetical protein
LLPPPDAVLSMMMALVLLAVPVFSGIVNASLGPAAVVQVYVVAFPTIKL